MEPYVYMKLNHAEQEIRLMILEPGTGTEPIAFKIIHTFLREPKIVNHDTRMPIEDLQKTLPQGWTVRKTLTGRYIFLPWGSTNRMRTWEHPDPTINKSFYEWTAEEPEYEQQFEALSYTWGDATSHVTAIVKSRDPRARDRTIKLGVNLATTLRHLRYAHRTRTMWVDAVCINQADVDERNHQLKRMRSIYGLSYRTLIWLGEDSQTDNSAETLSRLEYFGDQVEYTTNHTFCDCPDAEQTGWSDVGEELPYDKKSWGSLTKLLDRPWFRRVWVLQEALLSNSRAIVQCGHISAPWHKLRKAILVLSMKQAAPPKLRRLLLGYNDGLQAVESAALRQLLAWSKDRKCTDPRDKVYGLLALIPPALAGRILIDYRLPVADVYMNAVLANLEYSKRLDMLVYCRIDDRLDGAPSWVPNWTTPCSGSRLGYGRITTSAHVPAEAQYLAPGILEVTGLKSGTVLSTSTAISSGDALHILHGIRQAEPPNLANGKYITGCSVLEAFLEVLWQGHTRDRYTERSIFPALDKMKEAYTSACSGSDAHMLKLINSIYIANLIGMVIITTHDGYLGLAPAGVNPDDIICMMLGNKYPMLLRPAGTLREYTVVGPCYIHGMMESEPWLGAFPESWAIRMEKPRQSSMFLFFNSITQDVTRDDPRLPAMPQDWEKTEKQGINDDGSVLQEFRNKVTKQVMDSDPRMTPAALRERGVKLEAFRLV